MKTLRKAIGWSVFLVVFSIPLIAYAVEHGVLMAAIAFVVAIGVTLILLLLAALSSWLIWGGE